MEEFIGHGFTKNFSSIVFGPGSALQLPPTPAHSTTGPGQDIEQMAVASDHHATVTAAIIIMFVAAFTFGVALVFYVGGDVF